MKKYVIIALSLFILTVSKAALADTPLSLGDQVTAALTNHATFAIEYRHGSKNLILSDNVVEVGKVKDDYLFSADLGLNGATLPDSTQGAIRFTSGVRFNVSCLVKNFVPLKPEWRFLNHLEYYGRGYYDWTAKVWYGSLNLGYGFGPGTAQ